MAISKPHHIFLNIAFIFLSFFFVTINFYSSSPPPLHLSTPRSISQDGCKDFDKLHDYNSKCSYLKTQNSCPSQGYIDYLLLFYCVCGAYPFVGYFVLSLWLVVLFYLLGNTASVYFCSSLENLSRILRLPPTIAGVTLLSLGNGAPDAFATIASFASSGEGGVGLSSVLGGAFLVTSGVVGVISLRVGSNSVVIDRFSFAREIWFYLIVLCCLLAILVVGEIGFVGSILFVSLYIVYVVVVAISYCLRRERDEFDMPLLESVEVEEPNYVPKLEVRDCRKNPSWYLWLLYVLELPLYLPRRLTIPDVSEVRWSKPFAVASVVLSPILLPTLWVSKREAPGFDESLTIYLFGGLVGLILGVLALESTESSKPPNKFPLPWLGGEFLMSVVWFYITAGELVALLVSVGHIIGIISSWSVYPNPYVIPKDPTLLVTLGFLVCGLLWAMLILPRRGMKLDRVFGIGLLTLYSSFLCLWICDSIGLVQIDALLQLYY